MSLFKNTRIAWSVALASLALWAFGSPIGWGQVAEAATRLMQDQHTQDSTSTSTTVINISQDSDSSDSAATTGADGTPLGVECPPLPPAIAQLLPTLTASPAPAAPSADTGSFRLCGSDPKAEQDIAQLIGGRSFKATLSSTPADTCPTLTIQVTSQAISTGSSTTNLNVSLGSGGNLSVKIVSEGGATRVSIGSNA